MLEDKGNLTFGLGLNQPGHGYAAALVDDHGVGQLAKIRLAYAEHVHHCLAGNTDLFTDDSLTAR
ncbi:hypothetical protein D3C81_1941620 [compost metagenome]